MYPATKFRAPSTASHVIDRHRLIAGDASLPAVVVVRAPAGYGKTTVVAQWLRSRPATASPAVWVSLDEDDDDSAGLWGAVSASAQQAGILAPTPDSGSPGAVRSATIVPLLDAFAEATGDTVLVLDDLHRLTGEDVVASLDWFLGRMPENLTAVLISRDAADLPALERLRARNSVVDVSVDELRLDTPQITQILRAALDRQPLDAESAQVEELTAGWPAAVALVGAALSRGLTVARIAAQHAVTARGLDALVREGLAGSAGDDYLLLRQLAVFERFDVGVVRAVLETDAAWAAAMDAADRTGLIVALDDEGRWWRMHHLVRERLHAELVRDDPERCQTLHQRAAVAFEGENDVPATIHHWFGAEDYDAIADVLSNVRGSAAVPRQALGLSWVDRIPESARARDPRLAFWEAWAMTSGGDSMRRDAALARGRLAAPTRPIAGFRAWDDVEDFILGQACYGDVGGALRAGERFLARYDMDHPLTQTAAVRYATMLYLDDRCDDAIDVLDRIVAGPPLTRPLRLFVPAYRALCLFEQGESDAAAEAVAQAQHAREAFQIGPDPVYLPADLARARLLTETGDPSGALSTARRALELAHSAVDTVLVVPHLLLEVARAQASNGRRVDASVALVQAEELCSGAPDPGALPQRVDALRARFRLDRPVDEPREGLTRRELEVLVLLPTSMSASEIAAELFVSVNTVRTHVKSIYRKLGASSRAEAVDSARSARLIAAQ